MFDGIYDKGYEAGIRFAIKEIAREEGWEESEQYYLDKLLKHE